MQVAAANGGSGVAGKEGVAGAVTSKEDFQTSMDTALSLVEKEVRPCHEAQTYIWHAHFRYIYLLFSVQNLRKRRE